jgi:hypothetical protein
MIVNLSRSDWVFFHLKLFCAAVEYFGYCRRIHVEELREIMGKPNQSPVSKWYFTNKKQENCLSLHHEAGKKERRKMAFVSK